ncbi:MAG: hypothetical protein CMJ44_03010 [Pimelobacter sp.]|nr:hypothetical protein [Pimelobacter sp.]
MAKKSPEPTPQQRDVADSSKVWSVFSLISSLGAATVARKGLTASWKAATGKNPPANPADPDVQMREAVMWAAASGTLIAMARMLAQRRAAGYYLKSTGKLPPAWRRTPSPGTAAAQGSRAHARGCRAASSGQTQSTQ